MLGQYEIHISTLFISSVYLVLSCFKTWRLNRNRSAITIVEMEDKRIFESAVGNQSETPAQHIFACHCGQIEADLLTPIEDQEVKEDNCSSCVRVSLKEA